MLKKIDLFFIYFIGFLFIYQPGVNNAQAVYYSVYFSLTILIFIALLFSKGRMFTRAIFNKYYLNLFFIFLLASVYFVFRATIAFQETRFIQNTLIILQVISLSMIIFILDEKFNYNLVQILRFFLNIGMIQSIFGAVMLVFPGFRQLALTLYYAGNPENMFISGARIYGISSDYTFFTPIFHGFLAIIALNLAIKISAKYLYYIPPLLLIILLNGRTGFVVFFVGSIVSILTYMTSNIKYLSRTLVFIMLASILSGVVILLVKQEAPTTFNWLQSGLQDSINFIHGDYTGNFAKLRDSILFPKGLSFIFGKGFRLYGNNASYFGYPPSDIGYVNDMFMGGLMYVALLYFGIVSFIMKIFSSRESDAFLFEKSLSYAGLVTLVISNFKGEAMRGGLILLMIILMKFMFITSRKKDKLF